MRKQTVLLFLFGVLASNTSLAAKPQDQQTNKNDKQEIAAIQTKLNALVQENDQQSGDIKKLNEQNTSLVKSLQEKNTQYQNEIAGLKSQISQLEGRQNTASRQINKVNQAVTSLDQNTQNTTKRINEDLSNRTIAIGLGLLTLLALLATSYFMLRKRQQTSSQGLENQLKTALNNVKQSEENIVKSDTQLADKLLEVVERLKENTQVMNFTKSQQIDQLSQSAVNNELDHSLALKLADEIHRMRKRIEALPQETKGLKSLSKSLERLEEELNEQGYNIIDYTGQNYDENMAINAQIIPSDDLSEGQSIISKVISPQVNYQEKMIRMADVEVSVG